MDALSQEQVDAYWENGFLVLTDALTADQLHALNADFDTWIEESTNEVAAYGQTLDGRPRFDLEPGHSAEHPALRRVTSPVDISSAYLEVMRNSRALDAVAQLIGPNVEFNNSKVNSKQPGAATEVKYHQDFLFQPHSNEDLIAVLFFLDDVTLENGPLEVVPGSHRGPMYDHWHKGVFTGTVADDIAKDAATKSLPCTGPAGTACLMHTRLLHASAPNRSTRPRTLFIAEYRAEDSISLSPQSLPSIYDGEVVRGERTGRIRTTPFEMFEPEIPKGASFFEQQAVS